MSLFEDLQKASSEEDVKDIYIKALKLKGYQKNLIDIQTKEVWFEAKVGNKVSTYSMFTQLLFYVNEALKKGEYIPPFLCVIDCVKAALMKTDVALPLLKDKTINIKWGESASEVTQDALDKVSHFIGTHFVSYNIEHNEKEFIEAVHNAIEHGELIRTQITPDNLRMVFDKWVNMIGKEIKDVSENDYDLLFYADVMSDGHISTHDNLPAELLHKGNKPVFSLNGKLHEIGSLNGYNKFWAIYDRPPKEEYRNYILERRDTLIPYDERHFKGAFYTPLHVVDKAYEFLNRTLGEGWQKDYIVWDMCCGVGNLETKHSNPRNIFMSTIDSKDINIMKASKTCAAAQKFQYDYLEDDIDDNGNIDYSITNKVPQSLQKIIANAKSGKNAKKILVLINPPWGEATNANNTSNVAEAKNKIGIAKTKFAKFCMDNYGKATNELFMQFIVRIAKEIPTATLAIFSTPKYVNAQTLEKFRSIWNAEFQDGFIIRSKVFEGSSENFPISFCIWQTNNKENAKHILIDEISCEVLNEKAEQIGRKSFYNISSSNFLSKWIKRQRANKELIIPLSNCISPSPMKKPLVKTWSDNAIGYMCAGTNDVYNTANYTYILSSAAGRGHGFYVTPDNLDKASMIFAVQRVITNTWIIHNDQFYKPSKILPNEFKNDCLVYMLFNEKNLTASANDLEWNNRKWSIVNHFIPFTESEVNSPDRFESDFMVQYMQGKNFSKEASDVLEQGKLIWKRYFETDFDHKIRNELKLNRPDVGWYQIRQAIKRYNESGENLPIKFDAFDRAYSVLSKKLIPLVYDYGFLKA